MPGRCCWASIRALRSSILGSSETALCRGWGGPPADNSGGSLDPRPGSSPTNVLTATVFEVMDDSMRRNLSNRSPKGEGYHTPVLMYVASSPRAELVNLDSLSVPLLRMAFLRASARACAVDIVPVKVVEGDEGRAKSKVSVRLVVSWSVVGRCRRFESPIEKGIGATWLAGLSDSSLLFCPTSSTTRSLLRPCRRADPPTSSVKSV